MCSPPVQGPWPLRGSSLRLSPTGSRIYCVEQQAVAREVFPPPGKSLAFTRKESFLLCSLHLLQLTRDQRGFNRSEGHGRSGWVQDMVETTCPFHHLRTKSATQKKAFTGTDHVCLLMLNFQPPEPWEIHFCCLQATQSMLFGYSSLKGWRQPLYKLEIDGYSLNLVTVIYVKKL